MISLIIIIHNDSLLLMINDSLLIITIIINYGLAVRWELMAASLRHACPEHACLAQSNLSNPI